MRRPAFDVVNNGVVEARFWAADLAVAVISDIALAVVRADCIGADRFQITGTLVAALVDVSFTVVSFKSSVRTSACIRANASVRANPIVQTRGTGAIIDICHADARDGMEKSMS